jgi:hypothetical protein
MRAWMLAPVLGATLLSCPTAAQEGPSGKEANRFTLSGTSRLRYETISGQPRAGFNESDHLVNLRTAVRAQYESAPVTVVAELWDSRAYGADRGTPLSTGEVNTLELVQGYVEARAGGILGGGTTASLQAGRFTLNLGSRRLIAADDYRNTTNGYTGLRADLGMGDGWRATVIYTLPQQRRPDDLESLRDNELAADQEGFDQVLWGALVSRSDLPGDVMAEASFFHLGERDTPTRATRNRSLNTAGLRFIREPASGTPDFELEGFLQRGSISTSMAPDAPRQEVSAWFIHADIGYTFSGVWRPRLALEFDRASGDEPGGRYGRFDTLFGMRRADLAPAGLYNAFGRTNFVSPGLRGEVTPSPQVDAFITVRPVWLAARHDSFSTTGVRDPSGRSGSFAGTQLDARVRYRPSDALLLELDTALLAKGRFLRDAPNAPPGRWTRYMSLNAMVTF